MCVLACTTFYSNPYKVDQCSGLLFDNCYITVPFLFCHNNNNYVLRVTYNNSLRCQVTHTMTISRSFSTSFTGTAIFFRCLLCGIFRRYPFCLSIIVNTNSAAHSLSLLSVSFLCFFCVDSEGACKLLPINQHNSSATNSTGP